MRRRQGIQTVLPMHPRKQREVAKRHHAEVELGDGQEPPRMRDLGKSWGRYVRMGIAAVSRGKELT